MTVKMNAFVQNYIHIAQYQYHMEVDIYKKIWISLHELLNCLEYIDDYVNLTESNEEKQKEMQNNHFQELKKNLGIFEKYVDENAPFYQKEPYENLVEIGNNFQLLVNILEKHKDKICGKEIDNDIAAGRDICQRIEELKEKLICNVREYLNSLKYIE